MTLPFSSSTRPVVDLASVPLGPVVLDGERALVAVTIASALIVAEIWSRRHGVRSDAAWTATWVGLGVARLAFVALHPAAFRDRPWEIVYVWQGGFEAWAGVLAALVYATVSAVRTGGVAELRARGVAASVVAAVVAGGVALSVLPAVPALPSLASWPTIQRLDDGSTVDPATWVGSPTVVNLFATWCPPCRRELPMLVDMAEETRGEANAVKVAIVSQGERPGTVAELLRSLGLASDAVFVDPAAAASEALHVVGLPTTIIVAADGTVASVLFGETSRARLESELRALEARR